MPQLRGHYFCFEAQIDYYYNSQKKASPYVILCLRIYKKYKKQWPFWIFLYVSLPQREWQMTTEQNRVQFLATTIDALLN
jgi:hypothetical protein